MIGVLLGSFDPIHIGHLALVTAVLNRGLVKEVILVPAFHNPWKENNPVNYRKRYHMCNLAIEHLDRVKISSIELMLHNELHKDKIPSYQVLRGLDYIYSSDICIITTTETFNSIKHWEHGEEILNSYKFIIFDRGDIDLESHDSNVTLVSDFPRMDISSTMIRNIIKHDQIAFPYIPKEVEEYIDFYQLYK